MKIVLRSLLVALVFWCGLLGRAEAQAIGEATLNGGFARGLGSDGLPGSVFLSGSFAFVRGPFSLGPEVQYAHGDGRSLVEWGGIARWRLKTGRVRPYLLAGIGSYHWKRTNFVTASVFGASFGAGAVVGDPSRHTAVQGELRIHENLQNIVTPGSLRLVSIAVGIRFQW